MYEVAPEQSIAVRQGAPLSRDERFKLARSVLRHIRVASKQELNGPYVNRH
jgi:hypothetical protein